MKECPKCKQMNRAYADRCRYCGYEIRWVPDDGSNKDGPPDLDAEESDPRSNTSRATVDKADLEDIRSRLEELKAGLTKEVNLFDVTMPFGRMVFLILKMLFASIPAVIIFGLITSIFWIIFGGLVFRIWLGSYGLH
jgi:hypothetical protein